MIHPAATAETKQPLEGLQPKECNGHPGAVVTYRATAGACPVCLDRHRLIREHNRLLDRSTTTTVYRETEATRRKPEAIAEEFRCLQATIDVHLNTIRDQDQKIRQHEALNGAAKTEIQRLANLLQSATNRESDRVTETANLYEEIEEQADELRERDGTIKTYRADFRVMVEKGVGAEEIERIPAAGSKPKKGADEPGM